MQSFNSKWSKFLYSDSMDGGQVSGMAPVMEKLKTLGVQTKTASNFTPLPETLLQKANHAKHRALDVWRKVIRGSRKLKEESKSSTNQSSDKQADQANNSGFTSHEFMGGVVGVALGFLAGKTITQATPFSTGQVKKTPPQEGNILAREVHVLTSAEYTPENPSPDFLKGQQVGYARARETLEDGSKLWSLDWNLRPIDPKDMVYNLPGNRSLGSFRAAVHHLNLGNPHNGRYAKVEDVDRTVTFCNVAASDMADMFQVSHVFSRFDENGTPILANKMNDRIIEASQRKDHEPEVALITRDEAQQIADMGYPVFLLIKKERRTPNADWLNGHIGLVTPWGMLDENNPEHHKKGLYLIQAGLESGYAVYFDEREKYNEENGYLPPIFAIDTRDLKDARVKNTAGRQKNGSRPRITDIGD